MAVAKVNQINTLAEMETKCVDGVVVVAVVVASLAAFSQFGVLCRSSC